MKLASCVLVHGGWHGGWHWDEVARRLRAAGARVFAPTLCGLAERAAEASADTNLETHVGDVVRVLDEHDLHGVVLVGHSYGGAVVTGAAHRRPQRIAKVVYLDAFVPQHEQSLADIFGPEFVAQARALASAAGTPFLVPPMFSMEQALGVSKQEAAAHEARLTPHPLGTLFDAVHAPAPIAAERAFIYCSANSLGMFEGYAREAREAPEWRYFELPSPHDAVYAMPAAVAGILEQLASETGAHEMSGVPGEVLAADRAFFDALLAADAVALRTQVAPDFLVVDFAGGGVTAREDFIAGIASRDVRFETIASAAEEASVRCYGDFAIVVGRTLMRVALPGAGVQEVRSRYTHVFRRGDAARWQLVSAQGTPIAG